MQSLSFESLYSGMVAGSVAAHGGDVEQSVAYAAIEALGTSSIHYHFAQKKGEPRAFYFAVPSRAVASFPSPATPLVAAIPWHPRHQGEGAYVHTADGLSAAALFLNGELKLLFNSQDIIERHLREIGANVFDVSHEETGPLHSALSRGRRAGEKLGYVVSALSVFVLGLGCATAFAMTVANGYFSARVEDGYLARSRALAKVVDELNFSSPLSQQVSKLHQLSTVALTGEGWIEKYEHTGGYTTYKVVVAASAKDAAVKLLGGKPEVEARGKLVAISFTDNPAAAKPPVIDDQVAKAPAAGKKEAQ